MTPTESCSRTSTARYGCWGPSEFSDHRHEFLLRRGLIIAKRVGGLSDAVDDREAAEDIVQWINTEQTGW